MRVLPWFVGAAVAVAIGGAIAGGAIVTAPRQIHDPTPLPARGPIAFDERERAIGADQYPLRTQGRVVEVAELRERGLYSQDRYDSSFYRRSAAFDEDYETDFDFEAAAADHRRWEAEQDRERVRRWERQPTHHLATRQPVDRTRPAPPAEPPVRYVSRPVVQDTGSMVP